MNERVLKEVDSIFNPKSIAVVGVSERENNLGIRWLQSLIDAGFPVLYPVNPRGGEMLGLRVYPSIEDIPGNVDLAILIVPREVVPGIVGQCARKRTKAVVLYTSGYGESGPDGKKLEEEVVRIARQGGTRIIGPSCLGPYNPSAKLITQYVLPKQAGHVGVISHSGFLFNFISMCVTRTGIGPSKGISCGSDIDLTFVDFLEYFGQDTQTRAIVAYLEGIRDGRRLLESARQVSRMKPIIILKGGDTEVGREASASHTGTLAVPSAIWNSLCKQSGIISVETFDQMIDTLVALYHLPRSRGKRVAVITAPGGLAVTASDACYKLGLELPELTGPTREKLIQLVGSLGTNVNNPVDLGPIGAMAAEKYVREAIRIVIKDPNIDMLLVAFIGPRSLDEATDRLSAEKLFKEVEAGRKPVVFSGASLQGFDRGELRFLAEGGVPTYSEARRAAYALARLVEYSDYLRQNAS